MSETAENEIKEETAAARSEVPKAIKSGITSWSSNNLLGLFAFIISVGTFITFTYQTYLIRNQTAMIQKQQFASVLPYLTMFNSTGERPDEFAVVIQNDGVGPAFIQHMQVVYEGKTHEGSLSDFFIKVIYPKNPVKTGRTSLEKGSVIPAGKTIGLIMANDVEAANVLRDLFEGDKVKIEIVYTSVFEETWKISSDIGVPVKADQ